MNQRRQSLLDTWYGRVCPVKYRALSLLMRRRKPTELCFPRLLHEVIAARIGHGIFAVYHRLFHHEDAIY